MNIQSLSSMNLADLEALLKSLGVNPDDPRVPQTLKDFEALAAALQDMANDPGCKQHPEEFYVNLFNSAMNELVNRLNYLTIADPTPLISQAQCAALKKELDAVVGYMDYAYQYPANFANYIQDAQYALAQVEADFLDGK